MEVKEINNNRKQQYISSSEVNQYVSDLFDFLKEQTNKTHKFVKEEIIPMIKQWIQDIKDMISSNIIIKEFVIMNKNDIVEIGKKYKVEGSTGMAALKEIKNDTFYIHFAFVNDRNLIPKEQNVYITCKSDGLSSDVKELFNKSNLIIIS